jgi:hypothetical protein
MPRRSQTVAWQGTTSAGAYSVAASVASTSTWTLSTATATASDDSMTPEAAAPIGEAVGSSGKTDGSEYC